MSIVHEKIGRNKIIESSLNYLEVDPIKFLPFRLTTLKNLIDLLEKYNNNNDLILKIFQVIEKIKKSLRKDETIQKETLNELVSEIIKCEYYIISGDFQKTRDILKNIEKNIFFYKQEIKFVENSTKSLLSRLF